eukprot:181137_1
MVLGLMARTILFVTAASLIHVSYATHFQLDKSSKILHITDLHFDYKYKVGSSATCAVRFTGLTCCRAFKLGVPPYRKAGEWGDVNCDSPLKLILGIFDWLNRTFHEHPEMKPDFAIWTGDNPSHHGFIQSRADDLHATEFISGLFKEFLPGLMVYPCVGNHDAYPVDQLAPPPKNKWFTDMLVRSWKHWLDEPAIETLQKGGYYSILIRKGVRLVSLNTLYYSPFNILFTIFSNVKDPADQFAWLKATLATARRDCEKLWIISHFPTFHLTIAEEMNSLLGEYSDVIQYQFAAHTHVDELILNRLPSDLDKVLGVQFLAPSGVPSDVHPFMSKSGISSIRLYTYDPASFTISDWTVYTANATALNEARAERLTMSPLYSAREAYARVGLADMSAHSWE